jgi:hypothetical protein
MNRIRRRLLEVFSLCPLSLALSRIFVSTEYVVIDGWVMKRSDVETQDWRGTDT